MCCNANGPHVLTFLCSYVVAIVFHRVQIEESKSPYEPYKVSKVKTLVCEEAETMDYLHLLIPHWTQWTQTWLEHYVGYKEGYTWSMCLFLWKCVQTWIELCVKWTLLYCPSTTIQYIDLTMDLNTLIQRWKY